MQYCIFSFNRGQFLDNCVESIERCAPGSEIKIFDDNSTDPETQTVLARLARRHSVYTPPTEADGSRKHGGLYANMQIALDSADTQTTCCFLQDDMQLVRPVTASDLLFIEDYFDKNADAGFIYPAFLKGCTRKKDSEITWYCDKKDVYFVDRFKNSAGAHYSDVFIARAKNLHAVSWKFGTKESHNEQQARQHFAQMPHLRNPFVAYLPNGPAFRGRQQTRALRRAHAQLACGYYPFEYLLGEDLNGFLRRDAKILPYAEDFLTLATAALPEPWVYYPLQGRSLLKHLDRLERKIQNLIAAR